MVVPLDSSSIERELLRQLEDDTILSPRHHGKRTAALQFIEVVDARIETETCASETSKLISLRDELKRRIYDVDTQLYEEFRSILCSGVHPSCSAARSAKIREFLCQFTDYHRAIRGRPHYGFDDLDFFLDGLLGIEGLIDTAAMSDPEMIQYEATPARVVLDMVDSISLGVRDTFYDLGAGYGRVTILVNLLTGATSKGIEIVEKYSSYARRCARTLGLRGVESICADVREVDLSDGTVFFLFSPFVGSLLSAVCSRLHVLSRRRDITVCSYGKVTRVLQEHGWLHCTSF